MLLFLLVLGLAGLDAFRDPADGARRRRRSAEEAARTSRNAGDPQAGACRRAVRRRADGLASGGQDVLGNDRAARSRGAISGSRSRRCCCPSRSGRSGRWWSRSCPRSASSSPPTSCSGWRRCPASPGAVLRIFYSFMVPIFGGRLWTTLATWSLMIPGGRHRLCRADSDDALSGVPGAGAAVRLRRRQFRLLDGQHLLLLPEGGEGQRARAQCRPRQSRRQRRAVRGADRHHGRRVRLVRRRPGSDYQRNADVAAVAAECRLHLGAVHRSQRVRRMVRHERHRVGQGLVRRSGGDLPAQAQLDHVLALHRHLRLLHRLLRGLPAAGQDPVPERRRAAIRLPRPAGRRAVALGDRLDRRQMGRRRASRSGCSS